MSSAVIGCTLWDSYYFKFMSNWRGEPDSYLLVVMLTQAKIKLCSDIIGVVDNVRCNPQSKNIVFHIRDMSSAVIGCTLWDSYYFKFMSNWRGEPDSYLLVVMLTQAKIKLCSDCTNLIGVSALELMNKMIEDGEDDPKCFPEDLDALLGCTLAFKVRVQPSNRSSSVMKASTNPETIASIRSKLDPKMIKDYSGEGTCDSSIETNSKGGPEGEEDKGTKEAGICVSNKQSKTVGSIKSAPHGIKPKESSPKAICGPNTQSQTIGLNISGRHTKKIEESSPTVVCVSTKQSKSSYGSTNKSKSGGSTKSACHTGKNKEIIGQAGFDQNTEADMCMLTLSGSADHNPYVDFCVTPTKELLFDFEVDCDHLDDIPSVEFSRSKTKKRMKQDKL
ncbi:hypothetical protein DEO72_LG9g1768 [Vigna unguiculata]|uniref:Nucleic acid-binding n=1 Tax=Vigna unguiculata TaxID=3917 RepID=A0A4D6N1K4_VIGUN|nr:hypothetical protein DEO72_LG9g1768 [Vigna unguiculata]